MRQVLQKGALMAGHAAWRRVSLFMLSSRACPHSSGAVSASPVPTMAVDVNKMAESVNLFPVEPPNLLGRLRVNCLRASTRATYAHIITRDGAIT